MIAWHTNYFFTPNEISTTIAYYYAYVLHYESDISQAKEEAGIEKAEDKAVTMVGVTNGAKAAFRAVILGAPGSGKGTISARIAKQFNITHISSGDKLRFHVAQQTVLGKEVKKYLDSGHLVPDKTMISLINEEIHTLNGRSWLLDGFPRTVTQAQILEPILPVTLVINLVVPDSVILERLKNRWTHLPSGRVYNIGFNDPKIEGKDDVTGEPLCQRTDDQPTIVQHRLQEYVTMTKPVIQYYNKQGIVHECVGPSTDQIWPGIEKCLQSILSKRT
ncbi:GTP:AMP phosphotransferase AK3, mitochondrial isoform X2 [Copidosoma floridanum]|uniref:GTP:AMP phosphotransferase AK3, mitochondrial isoform X2 n=1 Tax=Copidosoma floridanum TaxID=29053 RepID=UPI000C6F7D6F|nr:GTP:AMP phosphotransferase AK3, mitochondrial isoform X2 [Copidosoma floridanum]